MSKETFYFSHDYNTRTDDKIKQLVRKWGMAGYGTFWTIVEDLYNNANALQLDYEGIAFDLRVDCEMIKSIINDFDLFIIEDNYFGSKSVERRLDERNQKSEMARKSAFKRWEKEKNDANAMRAQSECNAIKESKVKESKIKDIKSEKNIIPPTIEMVRNYCRLRGNKINAEEFIDKNEAKGWMIGKVKMRDWQATIRTWEKYENNFRSDQRGTKSVNQYWDKTD